MGHWGGVGIILLGSAMDGGLVGGEDCLLIIGHHTNGYWDPKNCKKAFFLDYLLSIHRNIMYFDLITTTISSVF